MPFVRVKLFADAAANRQVLGADFCALADAAREVLGARLVDVRLRQGSDAARRYHAASRRADPGAA